MSVLGIRKNHKKMQQWTKIRFKICISLTSKRWSFFYTKKETVQRVKKESSQTDMLKKLFVFKQQKGDKLSAQTFFYWFIRQTFQCTRQKFIIDPHVTYGNLKSSIGQWNPKRSTLRNQIGKWSLEIIEKEKEKKMGKQLYRKIV